MMDETTERGIDVADWSTTVGYALLVIIYYTPRTRRVVVRAYFKSSFLNFFMGKNFLNEMIIIYITYNIIPAIRVVYSSGM